MKSGCRELLAAPKALAGFVVAAACGLGRKDAMKSPHIAVEKQLARCTEAAKNRKSKDSKG